MEDRVTVQPQIKNHSGLFKFTERVTDIILVNRETVRVPTVMENPGKKNCCHGKVLEYENFPKSHGKVMELLVLMAVAAF